MAPRWFKNINFGRDLTNIQNNEIIENFRSAFEKKVDQITFDSTGPIIEEIVSDDEYCGPQQIDDGRSHRELEDEIQQEEVEDDSSDSISEDLLDDLAGDISGESVCQAVEEEVQEESLKVDERNISLDNDLQLEAHEESLRIDDRVISPDNDLQLEPQEESPRSDERIISPDNDLEQEAQEESQRIDERIISPVNHLHQQSHRQSIQQSAEEQSNLRRSKRVRWQPTDFARGQRPIYERNGPTFEFKGIEKGFPATNRYGKKNSRPSKKSNLPKNAAIAPPMQLRRATTGDYNFMVERITKNMCIGFINLEVGKERPIAKSNYNSCYIFRVEKGTVVITTIENGVRQHTLATPKTHPVTISQGARYSIKNCGNIPANLLYIVESK